MTPNRKCKKKLSAEQCKYMFFKKCDTKMQKRPECWTQPLLALCHNQASTQRSRLWNSIWSKPCFTPTAMLMKATWEEGRGSLRSCRPSRRWEGEAHSRNAEGSRKQGAGRWKTIFQSNIWKESQIPKLEVSYFSAPRVWKFCIEVLNQKLNFLVFQKNISTR